MDGGKRIAAGLSGAGLIAAPLLVRAAATATEAAVFVAGREVSLWACPIKRLSGVPCPACGVTRSVVLTVVGDPGAALELNPAGPLLVIGALLAGALLLVRALSRGGAGDRPPRDLRLWASSYGAFLAAVMLAHWFGRVV